MTLKLFIITFRLILIIPVNTETLENSTALKISILSENNFWMLLIKLLSIVLYRIQRIFALCQYRRSKPTVLSKENCFYKDKPHEAYPFSLFLKNHNLKKYSNYSINSLLPGSETPIRPTLLCSRRAHSSKTPLGGITAALFSYAFFVQLTNLP